MAGQYNEPFWYLKRIPVETEEPTPASVAPTTIYTPSATDTHTMMNDGGCNIDATELSDTVEPQVLLVEIQRAAEDVSQLAGRFGYKMAETLMNPGIKKILFAHSNFKQLRLSSMIHGDSFTCVSEKIHQKPIHLHGEAPLLWWLWDPLLEFLKPSWSKGCKLDFTPACKNNDALSYNITIRLWTDTEGPNVELTATYGGQFNERRIFNAPISTFSFPKKGFSSTINPLLAVDGTQYKDEGCYEDMWKYLMPRPDSIWCRSMRIHEDNEEGVIRAFAASCKASDDRIPISDDQDSQCQNLVRRFPSSARDFCDREGLIGETGGSYSKRPYLAPDIKD